MQMIGLGTCLYQRPGTVIAAPPPPPLPISDISMDGWTATWPSPPAALIAMEETFTVNRPGFDEMASLVQHTDSVGILARQRLPYPDENTLTPDKVTLSDFIHVNDSIGGIVNNSTRVYPKPIALWLNHDMERAESATHVLRLAVAHAYARNGKPVAAVRFRLSDGTTAVEQLVSTMSVETYASGLSVPHFAAAMDISTLASGVMLTADAVIYPWVGEAFEISMEGDSYPSSNLSTLRILSDHEGNYGTVYAYVDSLTGNNATGVASTQPATASANPFLTISGAAAAIKTVNNLSFGRNDAGGGVVRLREGVHSSSSFKTAAGTTTFPVTIEAADPSKVSTTVYLGPTTSTQNSVATHTVFRNITLRKQGGSIIFLDSGAGAGGLAVFDGCRFDLNGTSSYGAWLYRLGRMWMINCDGQAGQAASFSTAYKTVTAIGCAAGLNNAVYHAVGCKGGALGVNAPLGSMPGVIGGFFGWNFISRNSTGRGFQSSVPIGSRGLAVIGNIFEGYGGFVDPIVQINADSDGNPVQNLVFQMNTMVGERSNLLYLDGSVNTDKSGYVAFNLFREMNIKGDLFSSNSANTGNWPARYKVGWHWNMAAKGSSNPGFWYGPSGWIGEVPGEGEDARQVSAPPNLNFLNDQSGPTGAGNGDYTPGSGSEILLLPAGRAPYPVDILGRVLRNDGSGHIGAVQQI